MHARALWTGRRLRVEAEAWVDPGMTARESDELGRGAARAVNVKADSGSGGCRASRWVRRGNCWPRTRNGRLPARQ
jgi:hypothetical protein